MLKLDFLENMLSDFSDIIYETVRNKEISFLYSFANENNLILYINNKINLEGLIKPFLKFIPKENLPEQHYVITVSIGIYRNRPSALYFVYEDKQTYLSKQIDLPLKSLIKLEDLLNRHNMQCIDERSFVDEKSFFLPEQTSDYFLEDINKFEDDEDDIVFNNNTVKTVCFSADGTMKQL